MHALGGGFAFLQAAPLRYRSLDTPYRYRQESNFFYLTGWESPGAAALFRPGTAQPYVLFCSSGSSSQIGSAHGCGSASGQRCGGAGADLVLPISELAERMPDLLQGAAVLHCPLGVDPEIDQLLFAASRAARAQARRNGMEAPDTFVDISRIMGCLRQIKDSSEILLLRTSASITARAIARAMARTRPGIKEYHIEAIVESGFRQRGASGPAFPTVVAAGRNTLIPHYQQNHSPVEAGDLVLVDAGCEYGGYSSDLCRTFPASGRFTPRQAELYRLVLEAQQAGMDSAVPGARLADLHDAIVGRLERGLKDLGICRSALSALAGPVFQRGSAGYRAGSARLESFLPHMTAHWIGLDVHDLGAYHVDGRSRLLEPGMVLALEPGLYLGDGPEIPAGFRGLGIRIEDEILITNDGCELLSSMCPRAVDDVERMVGSET